MLLSHEKRSTDCLKTKQVNIAIIFIYLFKQITTLDRDLNEYKMILVHVKYSIHLQTSLYVCGDEYSNKIGEQTAAENVCLKCLICNHLW